LVSGDQPAGPASGKDCFPPGLWPVSPPAAVIRRRGTRTLGNQRRLYNEPCV